MDNDGTAIAPAGALEGLRGCGPLKAWSVIVTILGDLAAAEGARVPGPLITALTEPLTVKPEALRVAIHRLRRDGWIVSERDGRTSLYGLSAHGRAITLEAAGRIYGAEPPPPVPWHVVITENAEAMQALDLPDLVLLGPRVALLPGDPGGIADTALAWEVRPGALPGWLRALLVPDTLAEAHARLAAALDAALQLPAPEAALDRAVLRLLALHQWRRLLLRQGPAIEALMGPDWPGAGCRMRVNALLARLERPDPAALAAALPA